MLRVYLEGYWTALQFGDFFRSLQLLAEYFETGTIPEEFSLELTDLGLEIGPSYKATRLEVRQIRYASPGFTDLVGLAGVLREIRLLLQYLIDLKVQTSDRELSREERSVALEERKRALIEDERIRADQRYVQLITSSQIDSLIAAVDERRISGVSIED